MKVAVLVHSKPRPSETFLNNHITMLPFDVLVVYGGVFPYRTDFTRLSSSVKYFFKIVDIFLGRSHSLNRYFLRKNLKKHNIEVVLAEFLTTGANVMNVCNELKIPVVVTALGYDISNKNTLEEYSKSYKYLFQHCKKVVIVSNHMRKQLSNFDCNEKKIVFSPAGPSKEFFELNPDYKSNQVFAIGRFVEKKAPYLVLLAFRQVLDKLPDAKLVMAGSGPLLDVCKNICSSLGLIDSVSFPGVIEQEEQRIYLTQSRLFVQHSIIDSNDETEGTPVSILEAAAAGLPIISTRHAGISEVVIDGETGVLTNELDIDAMAVAIVAVLKNSQRSEEMGKAGRKYVEDHFTLEKHINIISKCIME